MIWLLDMKLPTSFLQTREAMSSIPHLEIGVGICAIGV